MEKILFIFKMLWNIKKFPTSLFLRQEWYILLENTWSVDGTRVPVLLFTQVCILRSHQEGE